MTALRPPDIVTVIIPTWNRARLLEQALRSTLAQAVGGLVVEVHDNASTDETEEVVRSFADERVAYKRHPENIGLFRNWSRALEGVDTPYVALLQDDDLWCSTFLAKALPELEASTNVSFVFADVTLIDTDGTKIGSRSTELPAGRFAGSEYLHRIVDGENLIVDMSAMVMRTAALQDAGGLDPTHQIHDHVFNLQFRMASSGEIARVAEPLVSVRVHDGQANLATAGGTAAIGMVSERIDAVARLLHSKRAADPEYRMWLADRLLWLNQLRSQYTASELTSLMEPTSDRIALAVDDLRRAIPMDSHIAVAGTDLAGVSGLDAWAVSPFPEIDGGFGGLPVDGDAAVTEIRRMTKSGIEFLLFPWPTFWWLDYYTDMRSYLEGLPAVVRNSRLVAFDIREASQ